MVYNKTCPKCGAKLDCYDIDFNFEGNQDEYSECMNCHNSFIFCVRYGGLWKYAVSKMVYNPKTLKWEDTEKTSWIFVFHKKENR